MLQPMLMGESLLINGKLIFVLYNDYGNDRCTCGLCSICEHITVIEIEWIRSLPYYIIT
jgi:hypothetical protein